MFSHLSHFFACILIVLMPLQALAAANMLVCSNMMRSSTMQTQHSQQQLHAKPCHMQMADMVKTTQSQQNCKHKETCKTVCATLCASIATITALPNNIKPATFLASSALISLPNQVYASITEASLQRPPIFLA